MSKEGFAWAHSLRVLVHRGGGGKAARVCGIWYTVRKQNHSSVELLGSMYKYFGLVKKKKNLIGIHNLSAPKSKILRGN